MQSRDQACRRHWLGGRGGLSGADKRSCQIAKPEMQLSGAARIATGHARGLRER